MAANPNGQKYSSLYNGSAAYAIPQPQWQEQEVKQPEHIQKPRPRRKPQQGYSISVFSIVGFIAVAIMAVLVLTAYVGYTDAAAETMRYKNRIEELSAQERKLTVAYEQTFDINEIENYARNVLGMDKPARDQVGSAATGSYDRAIVYSQSDSGTGSPVRGLLSFIASLTEYFK